MALTIRIHTDLDMLDGMVDFGGELDVAASLLAYCEALSARLGRTFPDADIDCTYSTRTGGAGSIQVLDEEFNMVMGKYELVDMLVHAQFSDTDAWVRLA